MLLIYLFFKSAALLRGLTVWKCVCGVCVCMFYFMTGIDLVDLSRERVFMWEQFFLKCAFCLWQTLIIPWWLTRHQNSLTLFKRCHLRTLLGDFALLSNNNNNKLSFWFLWKVLLILWQNPCDTHRDWELWRLLRYDCICGGTVQIPLSFLMLTAFTFLFFERIFIAVSYLTFEIVIINSFKKFFCTSLCFGNNYVWCLVNRIYLLYGLQL